MVDHGTLTVPIQVHSNETQTEDLPETFSEAFPESLPDPLVLKLTEDRATSPINNPNEKQLFEELEQITGHIIIQKFITRSEEEFQQLIKIRFPGMKVRETSTTHSTAGSVPPTAEQHEHEDYPPTGKEESDREREIIQQKNLDESSFNLPPATIEESLKSELGLGEVGETKQFESAPLEASARGDKTQDTADDIDTCKSEDALGERLLSDLEDQIVVEAHHSDSEEEPSLIEIKEIVMTPFSVSNSQHIPSSKCFAIGAEKVILHKDENCLEEEIVRDESMEDAESGSYDVGGGDVVGKSVYNSEGVSEGNSDPMTRENVDKDKVESESGDEEDAGASSTCYNSVIQSLNYFGIEEEEEGKEAVPLPVPGVTTEPDEDLVRMKSVATQTDERSSLRRSYVERNWDSGQSSSNSSTPSLLDLQLRVQKLDVRLRVGGGKRKGKRIPSATFPDNIQVSESEHLDILQVQGTKIKLNEDPITSKF